LRDAVEKVLKIDRKAIIEEFIEGEDITVGILKGEALPPIRIIPKEGSLYDYRSKYTKGMTEYELYDDEYISKKLQKIALKINHILDLKDFSRIDFRLDREGVYYTLEVNTIPGLTELSLLPMACKEKGIDFNELINIIIR
jgi:D-alanine-D-alanine ligase